MKIIVRKSDSIIIWGTNNNDIVVEVINNNLVIDGQVIATNINQADYDLIESPVMNLIDPFFVGYTIWDDGFFYSEEYQKFNAETHICLQEIREVYYLKSQDPQYTEQERQSFVDYYTLLDEIYNITYLDPTFSYPVPPDEIFPYYPPCSNN
jgi:hypothetical protein